MTAKPESVLYNKGLSNPMNLNQKFVCRICLNADQNKAFVAKELMLGLRDEFLYFECSKCKCVQIAVFPGNISSYYPSDYYSLRKNRAGKARRLNNFFLKHRIRKSILLHQGWPGYIISKLFPVKNIKFLKGIPESIHAGILDVGCGNGQKFLLPLHKAGFHKLAGCDPYVEENQDNSDGPVIYKKEISDMQGEWDIITFNHSFEHLEKPLETLQKAHQILKPGGYCIIRVPTVSSFAWKHYGINWFQLDAPRHYFLHSVESMRLLVEKSRFELVKTVFDSTHHQFTISERYKKGLTLKERSYHSVRGRLANILLKQVNAVKAFYLNHQQRGDQAIFYLKKPVEL